MTSYTILSRMVSGMRRRGVRAAHSGRPNLSMASVKVAATYERTVWRLTEMREFIMEHRPLIQLM